MVIFGKKWAKSQQSCYLRSIKVFFSGINTLIYIKYDTQNYKKWKIEHFNALFSKKGKTRPFLVENSQNHENVVSSANKSGIFGISTQFHIKKATQTFVTKNSD